MLLPFSHSHQSEFFFLFALFQNGTILKNDGTASKAKNNGNDLLQASRVAPLTIVDGAFVARFKLLVL